MRVLLAIAAAVLVTAAAASAHASATSAKPSVVADAKYRTVAVYRSPSAQAPVPDAAQPESGWGSPRVPRQAAGQRVGAGLPAHAPERRHGLDQDRAVDLSLDPYRVTVSLGAHMLTVTDLGG